MVTYHSHESSETGKKLLEEGYTPDELVGLGILKREDFQWPPEGYEDAIVYDFNENKATGKALLKEGYTPDQLVELGVFKRSVPQIMVPQIEEYYATGAYYALDMQSAVAPEMTFEMITNIINFCDDPEFVPQGYTYLETGIASELRGTEAQLEDTFTGKTRVLTDDNIKTEFAFLTDERLLETLDNLIGRQIIFYTIPGLDLPFCLIENSTESEDFVDDSLMRISQSLAGDVEQSDILMRMQLKYTIDKIKLALKDLENIQEGIDRAEYVEKANRYIQRLIGLCSSNEETFDRYKDRMNEYMNKLYSLTS